MITKIPSPAAAICTFMRHFTSQLLDLPTCNKCLSLPVPYRIARGNFFFIQSHTEHYVLFDKYAQAKSKQIKVKFYLEIQFTAFA